MIKIVLAALLIDLLIGDPVYPFHPIRLMGKLISFEEKKFLKEDKSDYEKFVAGSAIVVFNLIFSYSYPAKRCVLKTIGSSMPRLLK